jgi:hypothetical protein
MASLPAGIAAINPQDPWMNVHENFKHHFRPGASYMLNHTGVTGKDAYKRATDNLGWIIGQAMKNGTTVRALGAGWSLSKVAVCDGGMIQTKGLDLIFNPRQSQLHPKYAKTAADLKFIECGTQIAKINRVLEIESTPPRCIRASGGSNGQSIAGATSTGTHGAALYTGAVHDAVVGLHIVTGPGKHYWIERESYPVAGQELIDWLGAEPIRNDDAFNAAIVSFGSFGFIHGMMLETEPLYLLKEYRIANVVYSDAVMDAFARLDIAALRALLPGMPESKPGHELYHMEMNLNPYTVHKGGNEGMYVFLFYKVPVPAGYVVRHSGPFAPAPSPEFIWSMKNLLSILGGQFGYNQVRNAVTREFEKNIRLPTDQATTIGTIFRDTRFAGNIASFAFAVPTKHLPATIDHVLTVIGGKAFAGAVAVRFVKGTKATMAFTKFDATCVVEMDGLDIPTNHEVFAMVIDKLERAGIPCTIHWGKLNGPLNADRIKRMYEPERIATWKGVRERLLDTSQARAVFNNEFVRNCGLDTPAIPAMLAANKPAAAAGT